MMTLSKNHLERKANNMNNKTDIEKVYEILTREMKSLKEIQDLYDKEEVIAGEFELIHDTLYTCTWLDEPFYYTTFDFNDEGKCVFATMGGMAPTGSFSLEDNILDVNHLTEEVVKAMKAVNAYMIVYKEEDYYGLHVETDISVDPNEFILDVELLLDTSRLAKAIVKAEKKGK